MDQALDWLYHGLTRGDGVPLPEPQKSHEVNFTSGQSFNWPGSWGPYIFRGRPWVEQATESDQGHLTDLMTAVDVKIREL